MDRLYRTARASTRRIPRGRLGDSARREPGCARRLRARQKERGRREAASFVVTCLRSFDRWLVSTPPSSPNARPGTAGRTLDAMSDPRRRAAVALARRRVFRRRIPPPSADFLGGPTHV